MGVLLLLLLAVLVQQLPQLIEIDVLVQLGEQLLGPRLAQLGRVFQLLEVLHESLVRLDTVPARVLGEVQVRILQQVGHLVDHVHVLVQIFVGQRLQQSVVVRLDARCFHARGARTIGDDLDLLLHRDRIVRLVLAVQRNLYRFSNAWRENSCLNIFVQDSIPSNEESVLLLFHFILFIPCAKRCPTVDRSRSKA